MGFKWKRLPSIKFCTFNQSVTLCLLPSSFCRAAGETRALEDVEEEVELR